MKAATGRLARVPALVICAALMAAPAAAPVGDEPLVLFRGAGPDGGRGTSGGAPPVPSPDAAPDSSSAGIAEAAPAAVAGTAGARGKARPSGTGTAWEDEAGAAADPPDGGSRLLRALADGPEPGGVPAEDGAPVFTAEGCPRALLRRLLAGAVSEADALSALGIEREVLTLCRERQEIVTALFETEARLRALRAPAEAPVPASSVPSAAAAPAAAHAPAVRMAPSIESAVPSPLRAALAGAAGTPADAEPEPRYGWFSIIGSAGALRAGVTDGSGVWFVREGDPLPGGARIAAIAGRPPGVRVSGLSDRETPLPYRARPGGGS